MLALLGPVNLCETLDIQVSKQVEQVHKTTLQLAKKTSARGILETASVAKRLGYAQITLVLIGS